jgi:hypothetical protein
MTNGKINVLFVEFRLEVSQLDISVATYYDTFNRVFKIVAVQGVKVKFFFD